MLTHRSSPAAVICVTLGDNTILRRMEAQRMETIFTKIISRQIPAKIAYEDDRYIVIHDIQPQAPVHLLVITNQPIPSLNEVKDDQAALVGGMFRVAADLMKQMGHTEYRTVFNCGESAGQSVFHLHLHVLAGRDFAWPPG